MRISVLICTYNRHEMLRQALEALVVRTEEKPDQVIIVNGGDERADHVAAEFSSNRTIEIRVVKTVNKNLAASRNIGLRFCTGDIVAMTDDDAEVFPDWVIQMEHIHREHPEAGGVGGAVIGSESDRNFLSRLADQVTFVSPSEPCYVRTLSGVNVSYKREVIDRVGKQDEHLFRGEDVDYNWRVKQLGYEIYYHPAIKVIHHHRPTIGRFLRQHYMYGRAYYLVRRKWPEMYCVYPHGLKRGWDIVKGVHFFVSIIYQPVLFASRMSRWTDTLLAVPILICNQVAWKAGMFIQSLKG